MNQDFFMPVGGGNEIGASSYILRLDGVNFLIDAGIRLHSERVFPDYNLLNKTIGGFKELDAFFLTHAHLDHCGAITKVHYEAPMLPMFATIPTIALAKVMLKDALNVSSRQSEDLPIKDPTQKVLDQTMAAFRPVSYNTSFTLDSSQIRICPIRAGHILGAASYLFETPHKRVLITGDISLHDQRTIAGFDINNVTNVDVLIIESTYAYQAVYSDSTLEEEQFALVQKISSVIQTGGRVLIPAFALGRAQEIATLLGEYFEQGITPPFPVRMDGLVKPICDTYHQMRDYLPGRLSTRPNHSLYTDYVRPVPEGPMPSPAIIQQMEPCCVICSSGMLIDFSRSARYAEHFLANPKDAIFFSGYLDDESPGKRLMSIKNNSQSFKINNHSVNLLASVDRYHLSAHASTADLQEIILKIKPKHVIFMHGDFRYSGDPAFLRFLYNLEVVGVHTHQSCNGIEIYL